MATIVKGTVESLSGVDFDVYLDNGAPDGGGTTLPTRSAKLSYRSETEDVDAHLLTSKMSISFSVRNATQLAIFDGLIDAKELQYKLRIERDGVLWWVGFVLLDLVRTDFAAFPFDVKLSATDGISRLKSIDYNQNGLNDFATLKEHLFNIFTQMPLSDYYGAGDEYLRVQSTLVPEGMTAGVNIFNKVRVGFKALRTVDNRGRIKYRSYYDALREILQALNARITYSQGRYLIAEIANYGRPLDDVTFYNYNEAGTELAAESLTNYTSMIEQIGPTLAGSDAVALARGEMTQYPPLKGVDFTYKHYSRQNLFPGIVWNNANSVVSELTGFDGDGGAGKLAISANVTYVVETLGGATTPPNGALWVSASVVMAIEDEDGMGGQSLRRIATLTPAGVSYSDPEWIDGTSGTYEFLFPCAPPIAAQTFTQRLAFVSPVVPQGGTLQLALRLVSTFIKDGAGTSYGATITYEYSGAFVESLLAGSITEQYNYTNYLLETANASFNSVVLEREALLGDGPGDNTFGRIEYTENGTDWLRTNGWRRYSGAYLNTTVMLHTNMIAAMTMALQDTRRQVLDISIIGSSYQVEYLLGSQSALYLMQSGELDLSRDEWRGRWFEVAANFVDSVTTGEPTETDPVGGPGGGGAIAPDVPAVGGVYVPPSIGGSPGNSAPAINTVSTTTDEGIVNGDNIGGLAVGNLGDVPLYGGDIIVLTNPITGETQEVEVLYDSDLGVPDPDQITPGGTSVPYYGPDGIVWLIPDTGSVALVDVTVAGDFPTGSYVQPDPQFTAQLQALLRKASYDFHLFDYTETVTTGFVGPFWRAGNRIGWGIRKVHFAFGTDEGATAVKVNLKYYDATGFRYTVATFNSGGLGGIVDAYADVAAGYYRVEVETITGTAPKGLTVSIEMIKKT